MSENDGMRSHSLPSALTFDLVAKCSVNIPIPISSYRADLTLRQTTKARAATLHLPHGPVQLPLFMPVATQASLKGLTPKQLEETSCRLCLNNTYHLYDFLTSFRMGRRNTNKENRGLKPGQKTLDVIGGAHKLQSWPHNILTGKPKHQH